MSAPANDLAGRLAQIRAAIAAACERAGRPPGQVTLIGASKTQPASAVAALYDAGLRSFGENRVQEALAKQAALPADIDWHLIGPLQSNKVAVAVRAFATFHAVDRPKIAQALSAAAVAQGRPCGVFIEVNLGGEASKHGFSPAALLADVASLASLPGLSWRGLMAIPPPGPDPEASRPWFRKLAALRDQVAATQALPAFGGELSMGMSDDFAVAIEEGATHVRVGTALFGPRVTANP